MFEVEQAPRQAKTERVQLMMSPDEVRAVDEFWHEKKLSSRAAAVRFLLGQGIKAASGEQHAA